MFRASLALKSVGRAMASSNELVCRLWVPPITADMASMVVRMMLLWGSCSVSEYPDVWQCVRSIMAFGAVGLNFSFTSLAQSRRAARSLAISL